MSVSLHHRLHVVPLSLTTVSCVEDWLSRSHARRTHLFSQSDKSKQVSKHQVQLALWWKLLAAPGIVLACMAGARAPNTDPILPEQQDPMNLAEGASSQASE
ncbi:hypothetical protein NQZ68_018647 [Dissostichus eleginoides]|nr:hypothetical protein NQZ68_018647 [Dissostichus eleginoides]